MYRKKPIDECENMPFPDAILRVLVLNASLKHAPSSSNTEEVAELLLACMQKQGKIESEVVRLSDKNIPVGLGFQESDDDDWPGIVEKIKASDIVIFCYTYLVG